MGETAYPTSVKLLAGLHLRLCVWLVLKCVSHGFTTATPPMIDLSNACHTVYLLNKRRHFQSKCHKPTPNYNSSSPGRSWQNTFKLPSQRCQGCHGSDCRTALQKVECQWGKSRESFARSCASTTRGATQCQIRIMTPGSRPVCSAHGARQQTQTTGFMWRFIFPSRQAEFLHYHVYHAQSQ